MRRRSPARSRQPTTGDCASCSPPNSAESLQGNPPCCTSRTLSGATDPVVVTRATATAPPATAAEATVGSNEFKLIGIEEFDLASRKDRLVAVKGLLIKATPTSRLNITSVTTVADSCPAAPKK